MFVFRLARLLGKTVYEMAENMTVSEFYGWVQYLSLEPANSVEIQSALVAQVANNAMGGKATLKDMLITQQKREQSVNEQIASRPSQDTVKFAFGAFKK